MFFVCREKSPPYALDYTNPMNNINYETINNLKNKEILINNENAHLLGEKGALEKNLKKHSMFINALSWKKFNTNKKKSMEQLSKPKVTVFWEKKSIEYLPCQQKNVVEKTTLSSYL